MQRQSDHEKPLDALSPEEWDKLSTVDRYPSDSFVFSSHGCSLYIDNELVAAAFANLPQQEQSILILCFVLDMADGEIGRVMGMSRSAVAGRGKPHRWLGDYERQPYSDQAEAV